MCIVIDSDVFSSIAGENTKNHLEFKPLVEWISLGKGKVVYGGTKYGEEIGKNTKFRLWLYELEKKHKTVPVSKELIDLTWLYLTKNIRGHAYNDHHIVAIVIVSGCKLVCSLDKGLHSLLDVCYQQKFKSTIKKNCTCAANFSRPKIYKNKNHAKNLLCDRYIANCCR